MSPRSDDDALSWGGDDDPTLDVGTRAAADADVPPTDAPVPAEPAALPDGFTAVGKGSDSFGRAVAGKDGAVQDDDGAPPQLGNGAFIALGVLVGVYALFTIGWIVGGLRLEGTARFLLSQLGYRLSFWLAVAAPALWFGTVLALTRTARSWVRLVWLIGGLALLIPWPFVMVGAVGQ